tara:strand:+ start:76 stop:597 length:522 start_codon:yes stop_codon:yes gene_type:complete
VWVAQTEFAQTTARKDLPPRFRSTPWNKVHHMSVEELKSALRETLERRGTLGAVRANLQSEIFTALDSQVCIHEGGGAYAFLRSALTLLAPVARTMRAPRCHTRTCCSTSWSASTSRFAPVPTASTSTAHTEPARPVAAWQFNKLQHSLSVFMSGADAHPHRTVIPRHRPSTP